MRALCSLLALSNLGQSPLICLTLRLTCADLFLCLFVFFVLCLYYSFLQKQLSALGVVDAWDQKVADFSALGKEKIYLEDVLHWASLELVSDSGSKDSVEKEQHVEKPKQFYADHSFIILVKDNSTGALLMLGALDLAEGPVLHDEL